MKLITKFFFISLITGIALTGNVFAAERFIVAASTTSTVNSGLFDYLLPKFTRKHGIQIHNSKEFAINHERTLAPFLTVSLKAPSIIIHWKLLLKLP